MTQQRKSYTATGLAAGLAVLSTLPLVWMTVNSFRDGNRFTRYISPMSWKTIVPVDVSPANYSAILHSSFMRSVESSLLVTAVSVVAGLVVCSMAAFGLAAFQFRGRSALFGVIVFSFLIPFDAVAIPLASLFRDWGLDNTYTGLILPGIGNGLAVFLLRQFFLQIPRELLEAAQVDGVGWFGIYRRIYLPLSKPALIGAGLMLFLTQWQAYLWPLLIGTDSDKVLAPIVLANLKGQLITDYGVILAGSVILTAVPLAVVLLFQRHFTASLATTGLKG